MARLWQADRLGGAVFKATHVIAILIQDTYVEGSVALLGVSKVSANYIIVCCGARPHHPPRCHVDHTSTHTHTSQIERFDLVLCGQHCVPHERTDALCTITAPLRRSFARASMAFGARGHRTHK
eukprot:1500868-Amphidinium_carterae.1